MKTGFLYQNTCDICEFELVNIYGHITLLHLSKNKQGVSSSVEWSDMDGCELLLGTTEHNNILYNVLIKFNWSDVRTVVVSFHLAKIREYLTIKR